MPGVGSRKAVAPPEEKRPPSRLGRTPTPELLADIERASRRLRDPAARLRFLRETVERYQGTDEWLEKLPSPTLRRWLYSLLGIERLRRVERIWRFLHDQLTARSGFVRSLLRVTAVTTGAAAVVAAATWGLSRSPDAPGSLGSTPPPSRWPVAEPLAPAAGVSPDGVWQVDRGPGFEQYSNGLRIDTSLTVHGSPRRYRVFDAEKGPLPEIGTEPIGILFHTSESDIWPLEEDFNEKLRDSSARLLSYLRREHVYNYLIDRFGRAYRVVDDASRANHAGFSIWQLGRRIYLNLNSAFLAVSFETRWEGGRALPITEAQLATGRSLADLLRNRFKIGPEMCLGHGMVSVNPKKHLIGHHLDWARGFPFAAFGLPDQYATPPASVRFFGFSFDESLVSTMGEPWPGVRDAASGFGEEAARNGIAIDELRRQRRKIYDEWLEFVLEDQKQAEETLRAETHTKRSSKTAGG